MKYSTLVALDGMDIREIPTDEQTEDLCLIAVKQTPHALQYVYHQTEKICMAAILQQPSLIREVKNQTTKLCLAALRLDGNVIRHIRNPTYSMYKQAVETTPLALQYIANQTPELWQIAVSGDPFALQYLSAYEREFYEPIVRKHPYLYAVIEEQPADLSQSLVDCDPLNIAYVRNRTYNMCKDVIKIDPKYICYVPSKFLDLYRYAFEKGVSLAKVHHTPEISRVAVECDAHNILHLKHDITEELLDIATQTNDCLGYLAIEWSMPEEVQIKQIQERPYLIRDIHKPTAAMYLAAVSVDGFCLKYVPAESQTIELCIAAVRNHPGAWIFIHDRKIQQEILAPSRTKNAKFFAC